MSSQKSRTVSMPGSRLARSSTLPAAAASSVASGTLEGTYVYDQNYPHQGLNGQYRYVLKTTQPAPAPVPAPAPAPAPASSSSSLSVSTSSDIPISSLPNSSPHYSLPKAPTLAESQSLYSSTAPYQFDREPAAPEGTELRERQKQRVNPLLNPKFKPNHDAAGLGFGPLHESHFLYKSHWSTPAHWELSNKASADAEPDAFKRTKPGSSSSAARKYHPPGERRDFPFAASGLGYGHTHRQNRRYLAVKPTEDIMKLYPSQQHLEKFYFNHA